MLENRKGNKVKPEVKRLFYCHNYNNLHEQMNVVINGKKKSYL